MTSKKSPKRRNVDFFFAYFRLANVTSDRWQSVVVLGKIRKLEFLERETKPLTSKYSDDDRVGAP